MPEKMTVTALRKNLYQIIDQVLETGVSVEVERNGQQILITAQRTRQPLERLKRRHAIVGNPEDLVELKVAEWQPDDL
jgi:hypothetical protein